MRKKFYSVLFCALSALTLTAQNVNRELNPIEKKKVSLPAYVNPRTSNLGPVKTDGRGYTDGVFILNEDWFGHCNSTINFMYPDGEFAYRIFQKENPGCELGATAQYGAIFGDYMFITAKQEQDPGATIKGGRFNIVDAETMKVIKQLPNIGDGDGRGFVGVNDSTGYVGTNEGIYLFDIKNMEFGDKLKGSASEGGLYDGQVGMMVRTKTYVYAVQQSTGVLVIDPKTNEIIHVIKGNYSTLTQSKDGNVWVGGNGNLLCINPETQEESFVPLPSGMSVPDSWYAWTAGVLCASTQENAIFWTKGGGFNSGNEIYKYVIGDPSSLEKPFFTIPDAGRVLYVGAGLRVSPDDKLYLSVFENFGSVNYWQYVVDAKTGKQLACYKQDSHYWFPAMHIFPDNYAPEVKDFEPVVTDLNSEPIIISLSGMATDEDNISEAIYKSVRSVSDRDLLSASIFGDNLTLVFNKDKAGEAVVEVDFDSNGKIVTKELKVKVNDKNISFDRHKLTLNIGEEYTFNVTNRNNVDLSWGTTDSNVVTIFDGKIKAVGVGTATVTVQGGGDIDMCEVNVIESAKGIKLVTEDSPLIIQRDSTATIEVKSEPADAVLPELVWSSSKPSVAHISNKGMITALADGEAVIKVASKDNPEIKDSCTVKVIANVISVSLPETFVLNTNPKGKKHKTTLKPTFVPAVPTNKNVTWKSSDESIVTVDNGSIEAVKEGETTITVTTEDGNKTAECKVSCVEWPDKLTLDKKFVSMGLNEEANIKASIEPETLNLPLKYVSSNPDIVSVDNNGVLKSGDKYGEAEITVSPENGAEVYATCMVAVEIPVTAIKLDRDTIRQEAETFAQLTPTFYPENATFKEVKWKSTKMSYVRVSDDGQVSFVRPGKSNVIVTSKYGNIKDTCVIIVEPVEVKSFKLNEHEVSIDIDDNSYKLGFTYEPQNATVNTPTYVVDDEDILTIKDYNGQIIPNKPGSTWIHASIKDGELKDSCLVHITSMIDSVKFERNKMTVGVDSVFTIAHTIHLNKSVEDASLVDQSVRWSTDNEEVINVSEDGKFKAIAEGTANVFVQTNYGDLYDYCTVTVVPEYIYTKDITISAEKITLRKGKKFTLTATVKPTDATEKDVVWKSEDENIATVSNEGEITGTGSGVTNVTATTADGRFTAKCNVRVTDNTFTPVVNVIGTDAEITIVKADEATIYKVNVYNIDEFNEEMLYGSYEFNADEFTDNEDKFNVTIKDLTSNSTFIANVIAINEKGGINKTVYDEKSETFVTTVPTSIGGIYGDDSAFMEDGALNFRGLEGASCYVADVAGNIVARFNIVSSDEKHMLNVPEGTYILYISKDGDNTNKKIIVK